MKRTMLFLLGVVTFCSSVNAPAFAQLTIDASAKKLQFSLVNYVPVCSSPDTTDPVSGVAACTYSGPGVGVCKFAPNGKGSLTLARKTNKLTGVADILLTYKLSGLDAACEGKELFPEVFLRQTHDGCANGQSCANVNTGASLAEPQFRCTVTNGKCQLKNFATATEGFEIIASGRNTTLVGVDCTIREFPANVDGFSCGISFE